MLNSGGEARLSILMTALELICILLGHNVLMNKDVFNNIFKYIFISIILSIIVDPILLLPNFNGEILIFIILFILTLIIGKNEERDKLNIFCELCIAQFSLMILQAVFVLLVSAFVERVENNSIETFSIMIFIVIAIIFLGKVQKKVNIDFEGIVDKASPVNIVLINSMLILYLVKLFTLNFKLELNIIINLGVILVILIGINIFYLFKLGKRNRVIKKEEINENINPLIENLINNMRASEHEYKNHLNMLYCMVQVCREDELKDKIKDYIGEITSNDTLLSNISQIENTIIKAILFSKVQEAKNNELELYYTIESNLEDISLDDSELTVILSNLLNNAIEGSVISKEKFVELDIYEEEDKYIIYVRNSVAPMAEDKIKKIFKPGYSTKGENRGYGLSNIKNILDKHKGKLNVNLEKSFFELNIELPILD